MKLHFDVNSKAHFSMIFKVHVHVEHATRDNLDDHYIFRWVMYSRKLTRRETLQ